jgi:hypothetical protein
MVRHQKAFAFAGRESLEENAERFRSQAALHLRIIDCDLAAKTQSDSGVGSNFSLASSALDESPIESNLPPRLDCGGEGLLLFSR